MIAVLGGPGVGKTTLSHQLASMLAVRAIGPDDFRPAPPAQAWQQLLAMITPDCVVESCAVPSDYRALIDRHHALVVGVRCASKTQARRLHDRGWTQKHLRRNLNYRAPIVPHLWVQGDGDVADMAQQVLSRYATVRTCPAAVRPRSAAPRSTAARGYGPKHQQLRRRAKIDVDAGRAYCARCHRWISPGEPWDLGHDPFDRSRYLGPMHQRCNRDTRLEKSLRRPTRHRVPAEVWL